MKFILIKSVAWVFAAFAAFWLAGFLTPDRVGASDAIVALIYYLFLFLFLAWVGSKLCAQLLPAETNIHFDNDIERRAAMRQSRRFAVDAARNTSDQAAPTRTARKLNPAFTDKPEGA